MQRITKQRGFVLFTATSSFVQRTASGIVKILLYIIKSYLSLQNLKYKVFVSMNQVHSVSNISLQTFI
jgi:uncharacterized membrane protein YwzB